jgi:hypothetical protein
MNQSYITGVASDLRNPSRIFTYYSFYIPAPKTSPSRRYEYYRIGDIVALFVLQTNNHKLGTRSL